MGFSNCKICFDELRIRNRNKYVGSQNCWIMCGIVWYCLSKYLKHFGIVLESAF